MEESKITKHETIKKVQGKPSSLTISWSAMWNSRQKVLVSWSTPNSWKTFNFWLPNLEPITFPLWKKVRLEKFSYPQTGTEYLFPDFTMDFGS